MDFWLPKLSAGYNFKRLTLAQRNVCIDKIIMNRVCARGMRCTYIYIYINEKAEILFAIIGGMRRRYAPYIYIYIYGYENAGFLSILQRFL